MKNYCQNPLCYLYDTKDRLRGIKGNKVYQNRVVNSRYYYGCCTQSCLNDYLSIYLDRFMDYVGRLYETPQRAEHTPFSWDIIRQERDRLKNSP
jgi:hypothetical protein